MQGMDEGGSCDGKWQAQLRKGTLELAVLAAIAPGPVYGLALLRRLQAFPSMAIGEGTLYPLLDRLKREGLLEAEWVQVGEARPRKYYRLSPLGEHRRSSMAALWSQSAQDLAALTRSPS